MNGGHLAPRIDRRRARRVLVAAMLWGASATLLALAFAPRALPEEHAAFLERSRDPRGAVTAWERAAAEDASLAPFRDVVRGLAAVARAETALVLASGPDVPPSAYDRPIEAFAAARDAFADAVLGGDALQGLARRNAERAWLRLEELRALQQEARDRRQEDPPPPDEQTEAVDGEGGDETRVAAVTEALPEAQVGGLLERLSEKQDEKRASRRENRDPGAGGDW